MIGIALAVAMLLPPSGAATVLTRHFTPQDQQALRYAYVPFTVAPGTTRIDISYSYDKADGRNVIDLGLFEPGPLTLGTAAFRGWSGGARDTIMVAVGEASPGYWPGPLPPGEWHVMLGLYKVSAAGVDVRVIVTTSDAPAKAPPRVRAPTTGALKAGPAWFAGAMHTHTVHSDGVLTAQELAAKARGEKLDFLVITDHNNTTQQLESVDAAAPGLLVITGEEVTTPGGHFNVWNLPGERAYIDFRIQPGDPAIRTVMKDAKARGALVSINHPVSDCFACSWTHEIPAEVNAIEIANGPSVMRQQQMTLWDQLLREGRRVTAVGESDWHRGPLPVSTPSVRVWASELSTSAILEAVRAGRVVVVANGTLQAPDVLVKAGENTAGVGGEVTAKAGDPVAIKITLHGAGYEGARVDLAWDGEVVETARPVEGVVQFQRYPVFDGYLRVQVVGADGNPLAIANPVFIKIAAR